MLNVVSGRYFSFQKFMVLAATFVRDAYGFAVRPQHIQRYREYAKIYKVCISSLLGSKM